MRSLDMAMILAAGRGERLRPLTDTVPKPLVRVGPWPLLDHHLIRLQRAGIRRVVINVAHLADRVEDHLNKGHWPGLEILVSREREALETAGGLAKALPWLQEGPFLLLSADIWTDASIEHWCARQWPGGAFGHLAVVANPPHHPDGDFVLASDGSLHNKDDAEGVSCTYAGMAVLSPELCREISPGKSALAPYFRDWCRRALLTGEWLNARWCDVGTPERLEQARRLFEESNA